MIYSLLGLMEVEIFVHPTCTTCHTLIRLLRQWNLIDKVKIYDTSKDPYIALERGVRSVPSIFIDNELVFAGIVDFAKLRQLLMGLKAPEEAKLSDDELAARFIRGVLDSVATAAWLYVNEDCSAFTRDLKFLKAITNLSILDGKYVDRLVSLLNNPYTCRSLIEANEEGFLRAISVNFVREVYWLMGKVDWGEVSSKYSIESIAHWLMVRGSVSRVGLIPHRLSEEKFRAKVTKVYEYIKAHFSELMDKVSREQAELESDPYWLRN